MLPIVGVYVVHLVRSPLDVIASLAARELLDTKYPFARFVDHHAPFSYEHGPKRAAAYWLAWNEMAAAVADTTWRTGEIGVAQVLHISNVCGLVLDPERVARALNETPRDTNSFPHGQISLDALEELAEPVRAAAELYGVPLGGGS